MLHGLLTHLSTILLVELVFVILQKLFAELLVITNLVVNFLTHKNMIITNPHKIWGPPLPPHYAIFGWTNGSIFQSCPRVPKLRI